MHKNKTLNIDNQISNLEQVAAFLEELGEEWELSVSQVLSLNLVLEEALSNIILYGFEDNNQHSIEINFKMEGDQLTVSLIDDGQPYDPTLKDDPDTTLSAEERPVGGLGIFLIKKIMDNVEYERKSNKNFLVLTKNMK